MALTTAERDDVVVVTMDDGKVNAFDLPFFAELEATLNTYIEAPLVLAGRPGMFSAGLNTKVLAGLDAAGLAELLDVFGRTMLRVWLEPRPVVAAVTGHAIAGGTILAMCADHAVVADGDYRLGLTETTIDFALPHWVIALARGNVRADRLDDLLLPGDTVGPAEAVAVGFVDALAPSDAVIDAAVARAAHLATLPHATYAETKRRLRGPAAQAALEGMAEDQRAAMAG